MRKGFSLVELSIVLVILGLLVGGVLAGQSLIQASKLRSISTDFQRYTTAVYAFRDKYFALPGDMATATSFWGAADGGDGLLSDCGDTVVASGTATCNGNGDRQIPSSPTNGIYEQFRAWQHLANAGLVQGTYVGAPDAGPIGTIGRQIPASKLERAGYVVAYQALFYRQGGNLFKIAGKTATDTTGLNSGVLLPEEAWNLDTKMDDGLSDGGRLLAIDREFTGCVTNATAYTATTYGTYMLDSTTRACALFYFPGF